MLSEAVAALRRGEMIVVADDRHRENEGDLVMAAAQMTRSQMVFYLRHGSGIVCVPMTTARAAELQLPPMTTQNTDPHATAFTISADHVATGTGISAGDRALTVRALADPTTTAQDLRRPGHVFPLCARAGGVFSRAGHTEATVDLLELAGQTPVGVITELVDDHGNPMRGRQITDFASSHGLTVVSVEDIRRGRRRDVDSLIACTGRATLPLAGARFTAACYSSAFDGVDHLALVLGDVAEADASDNGVLVRVHHECLTGDVFGSRRCECGDQLQHALDLIAAEGVGVVVYLRALEGRAVAVRHPQRADPTQRSDATDIVAAQQHPVDCHQYGVAAAILADIGVRNMRVITNDPRECDELTSLDLHPLARIITPAASTNSSRGTRPSNGDGGRADCDLLAARDV